MTPTRNTDAENAPLTAGRFPFHREPFHEARTCHKCLKGKVDQFAMTDSERRELANELAEQGFDIEYLAHHFGLTPRNNQTKRAVDGDN